ncbi:MAG: hypothetical protein JSU87_03985 [Gemmatimonadota bacterium]|nr:MAG: hypothetical protein JSU87_03985 [Gemmatimonadota bacterium]
MAQPGLILFDDRRARAWQPFTLTRPAGELLFGSQKLVERAERSLGLRCIGYLTSEHLADFEEVGAPPVLSVEALPADRDSLFWCSRAVIEVDQAIPFPTSATLFQIDDRPVGIFSPAGMAPDPSFLEDLTPGSAPLPSVPVRGRLIENIWDLLLDSPEQLGRDLAASGERPSAGLPAGVYREGGHPLSLGNDVRIEPGVLFDTREGPIRLESQVEVRSGTRLSGPALIGPHSRLLGGPIEKITAGPYSYLQGEVAECVFLGYTNKAHGGHLGHAYVGRWVNLGAFTTNSDLKNNYGSVRLWTPDGVQDTGRLKLGCFLGDHVKTGIGLLLGTGTVVGAGANVYGNKMPPRYVEPFSWGEGDQLGEYRLADFIETAQAAMARRGVDLGERGRRYLEYCWRKGRGG